MSHVSTRPTTSSTGPQRRLLESMLALRSSIDRHRAIADESKRVLRKKIKEAWKAGVPMLTIASVSGYKIGKVSRIILEPSNQGETQ